jgi:myo-inositol-1(or 4)-monophosphatase
MTPPTEPWLSVCREAVADVERVLARLVRRSDREPVVGAGLGGDDTTAIDAAAEAAIVARLESLHARGHDFTLLSEELGERRFGDSRTRLVVDPIDGSNNAKRGIRFFSFSVAVAEGETMADVVFGFVHDFGSGEEWTAVRGGGAYLDGARLDGDAPKPTLEMLAFEATDTETIAEFAPRMNGVAERLRVMGSLALSLCHLAAGRLDGVCSLKGCRAVDIAAAQLLVRERGFAVELPDDPPLDAAALDNVKRSRVVAAATPALCARLYAALG